MRKFYALIAMLLLSVSCATVFRAPARLERFVNRTERRADRYNIRDWQVSTQKYERLLREYIDNYRIYTTEEKRTAMKAIGRYHALLVDHGLKESLGIVYDLKDIIPSYLGGLKDIFDRDAQAVKDFLSNVLGLGKDDVNNLLEELDSAE